MVEGNTTSHHAVEQTLREGRTVVVPVFEGDPVNEQANIQLVRETYQHFKTGDIRSVLNVLTEDVLWELPDMANVPFAGSWRGRQQVGTFFHRLAET